MKSQKLSTSLHYTSTVHFKVHNHWLYYKNFSEMLSITTHPLTVYYGIPYSGFL